MDLDYYWHEKQSYDGGGHTGTLRMQYCSNLDPMGVHGCAEETPLPINSSVL